jgi:hypothetical protein
MDIAMVDEKFSPILVLMSDGARTGTGTWGKMKFVADLTTAISFSLVKGLN